MTWLGLVGLWLILGIGVAGLLWLTRWPDLEEDHREFQVRARRGLR